MFLNVRVSCLQINMHCSRASSNLSHVKWTSQHIQGGELHWCSWNTVPEGVGILLPHCIVHRQTNEACGIADQGPNAGK